jgi:MFS family permease
LGLNLARRRRAARGGRRAVTGVPGFSAIRAGVALLPLTIPLLFVAPLARRLYDRVGPRPLLALGSLLIGLGLGWLAMHLHLGDYAWLVPGYTAMGIGIGLTIFHATTARSAPPPRASAARRPGSCRPCARSAA